MIIGLDLHTERVEQYVRLLKRYAGLVRSSPGSPEAGNLKKEIDDTLAKIGNPYMKLNGSAATFGGWDAVKSASPSELSAELRARYDDLERIPSPSEVIPETLDVDTYGVPIEGIRRFLRTFVQRLEEEGRGRGVSIGRGPSIEDLVKPITSKIQLKIALKQKFDDLKQQTPRELHPDLEKAFRQAMEQLDKQ